MIDGNKSKFNVSGNGLSPFQPSPFRDDIKSGLYDYDRSIYEVSPLYHNLQATIKGKPVQIVSFNQRTNNANIRYPNGEKATVTLPDNFFYKYDPTTRELARREEIQSKQELSGADPVGLFVVETAALGPLFKLAGKAIGGAAKKVGEDFITSYVGRQTLRNLPKGVKDRILINLASKTINNANPYVVAGGDDFLYHLLKPVDNVLKNNKVPTEGTTVDIKGNVVDDNLGGFWDYENGYYISGKHPHIHNYFATYHSSLPRNSSREELTRKWLYKFGKYFTATPEDPNNIGYFEPQAFIFNNAKQMKKRAINTLDLSTEEFNKLSEAIDNAAKKRIYVTPRQNEEDIYGWYNTKTNTSHFNAYRLPENENSLRNTWIHELLSHGTDDYIEKLPVKESILKLFYYFPRNDKHYTVSDLYRAISQHADLIDSKSSAREWYELRATLEEARRIQKLRERFGALYGDSDNQTARTILTHPLIASDKKIFSKKTNGYAEKYIKYYMTLPWYMRRGYNKRLRILMSLPSVTGGGYLFTQPYLNNNSNER